MFSGGSQKRVDVTPRAVLRTAAKHCVR